MNPWRNSASSIVLIKNALSEKSKMPNFKILLQKRSNKAKFLPSTLVFPGGVVSSHDSPNCWLDHFKQFGIDSSNFGEFQNSRAKLAQIFHEEGDTISRHVSLRITAIRELFEELGILICKKKDESLNDQHLWATCISDFDIPHWQKKVHENPENFLNLCEELNCYPDIWSLHLWNNWLTPVKGRKFRFDTVFFTVAFEAKPPVFIEKNEVADVTLISADDTLKAFDKGEVEIIFPQWYELTRLKYQQDINELVKFAHTRSPFGSELFFPIRQTIKDGILSVLPGDELYPKNPDMVSDTVICDGNKTFDELYSTANVAHRVEFHDNGKKIIRIKNYKPQNFHLSPCGEDLPYSNILPKSQL